MKTPCSFPRTGLLLALFSLLSLTGYGQWTPGNGGIFLTGTGGVVGVGTSGVPIETNPDLNNARLVVKGGVTGTATTNIADWCLKLQHATAGSVDWLIGTSANGWGSGPGKFLISNSLGSSALATFIIDNNRNVGIGQINPAHKLDVAGDMSATQILIGVASTTPSTSYSNYKLAVGGKAIAEEFVIKLQTNWPDYVFEDTYKLPSLLEVERYIRENKHLPELPSAQEVQQNGLTLGEMNALLLKKIEELTLYVIDLKKESIESQKKMAELQKEIEALKAK